MARFSLEDLHVVPMPELKGPDWIVGTTAPVHRVRYRLWLQLFRILDRASDRLKGIAYVVHDRVEASGPQPIIDETKLPTSASFVWSDWSPFEYQSSDVKRDA